MELIKWSEEGCYLAEKFGKGFRIGEEVKVSEAAAFGSDGFDWLNGAQWFE